MHSGTVAEMKEALLAYEMCWLTHYGIMQHHAPCNVSGAMHATVWLDPCMATLSEVGLSVHALACMPSRGLAFM